MTDYIHDVAIDTESFLEATLQEPVCCASDNADNFVDLLVEHGLVSEDSKQELVDAIDNKAQWACEILDVLDAFGIEYTDHGRDNTYNQENDLSSDFIWQVVTLGSDAPSDWFYSDNPLTFVFIDKHEGGDPLNAVQLGMHSALLTSYVNSLYVKDTTLWVAGSTSNQDKRQARCGEAGTMV